MDKAPHLLTKAEINLSYHREKVSFARGLGKTWRYWFDNRNWAWTALRYGIQRGRNPQLLTQDQV